VILGTVKISLLNSPDGSTTNRTLDGRGVISLGLESQLELDGWSKSRRVVILRRKLRSATALVSRDRNLTLFADTQEKVEGYEYAALVTFCAEDVGVVLQLKTFTDVSWSPELRP